MAKKTKTLWFDDSNPSMSVLRGKVGAVEFNKAFKAEGWSGDWIHKSNLQMIYLKKSGKKYREVKPGTKGATLYTVSVW